MVQERDGRANNGGMDRGREGERDDGYYRTLALILDCVPELQDLPAAPV